VILPALAYGNFLAKAIRERPNGRENRLRRKRSKPNTDLNVELIKGVGKSSVVSSLPLMNLSDIRFTRAVGNKMVL
jgi:hypothetical protein